MENDKTRRVQEKEEETIQKFLEMKDAEDLEKLIPNHNHDSKKRVCQFCNREFDGGKALGGHVRIHFPKPKLQEEEINKDTGINPNQIINPNKRKQLEPDAEIKEDNRFKCSLCHKTFHSKKSMFGHLRTHPERDWRGCKPPSVSGADGTGDGVDLINSISTNWPMTAKRGSTNNSKPISEKARRLKEKDKELLEGATDLWLLRSGKTRPDKSESQTLLPLISIPATSSDDLGDEKALNLSFNEEDDDDGELNIKFISDIPNKEKQGKKSDLDSQTLLNPLPLRNHWQTLKQPLNPFKLPIKNKESTSIYGNMMMSAAPNSTYLRPSDDFYNGNMMMSTDFRKPYDGSSSKQTMPGKEYKCSICEKAFLSYHGLGGHMSIHNENNSINGSMINKTPQDQYSDVSAIGS